MVTASMVPIFLPLLRLRLIISCRCQGRRSLMPAERKKFVIRPGQYSNSEIEAMRQIFTRIEKSRKSSMIHAVANIASPT